MAFTTTSTVAGTIMQSLAQKVLLDYAIDAEVMLPRVRMAPIAGGSDTAAFGTKSKGSAAAITEGTGLSSDTTFTISRVTQAASEVGLLRNITKRADRLGILGEGGLIQEAIEDGARLCREKMETDILAVFTSASTSVGTSGATATVANLYAAVSQAALNKARGEQFFVLTGYQYRDINAQAATSGAALNPYIGLDRFVQGPDNQGYVGRILGKDAFVSNNCPTASSDKVGALCVDGMKHPENAPIGVALGWMPEAIVHTSADIVGTKVAVTAVYGAGEVQDFNYVKIVTIGS